MNILNTQLGVAAYSWWLMHRPIGWSQSEHLEEPEINCAVGHEMALARAVALAVEEEAKSPEANRNPA